MIIVSESAKKRLNELLSSDTKNIYVRVGVESGGCSGLSYKLAFDNKKTEESNPPRGLL